MKSLRPKITLILFLILWAGGFFLGSRQTASVRAAEPAPAPMDIIYKQGIEKIFNLEEKEGVALLTKAMEADRENPLGWAFLALAHLFSYETSFTEKERGQNEEAMLRFEEETLAKGEKRIEKRPREGEAYWAVALARMAKVRWLISKKRYFATAQEARNMWQYLETARALDPENHDLYFAMGLVRYHLDHLPGFSRFLSGLLITSADRQKGLQELEIAAQKGNLFRDLARAELLSAYVNFEKQPIRALPLARELQRKFPQNYNFAFSLANILSDLARTEEALAVAAEINQKIKSGKPPYRSELWARYYQLMGKIYLDQGEYPQAADFCKRAIQDMAPYNARVRAWALVRLGMICDAQKDRKAAEEFYRRALEVEGGEGVAQVTAKQYLQTPFVPRGKEEKGR